MLPRGLLGAGVVILALTALIPSAALADTLPWSFETAIAMPVTPSPSLSKAEKSRLLEQLDSYETGRSVGSTLTWTGIILTCVGAGIVLVGGLAVVSGAFSLNLGEFSAGVVLWYTGFITGGVGILSLVVGIPVWAVYASRVKRVRRKLILNHPTVQFDPQRKSAVFGWAFRF